MAIDDLAMPPRMVGRQDVSPFAAVRVRPVRRLDSTGGLGSGRGLESVMHNRAVLGSATKMRKRLRHFGENFTNVQAGQSAPAMIFENRQPL